MMTEKAAVVVGGTKGIGREIARRLVGSGHRVDIVGRPGSTGAAVAAEIGATFLPADVSELSEVRRLAAVLAERHDRLHWLVQSADVLTAKRIETSEGFEVGFATNYLSRFALVGLLLDQLQAGPATILHVAAAGAGRRFRADSVPPGPRAGSFRAHGAGQGANDVFGVELADRLTGTGVRVHVANPGAVETGIRDEIVATPFGRVLTGIFARVMKVRQPAETAEILLDATARHPDAVLIGPDGRALVLPARVRDLELRRRLWQRTEELTGVRVPAPARP
jgi:NAD(P)-dependent dehydrogenase (short-subunit alcohol dehydrogenase family)